MEQRMKLVEVAPEAYRAVIALERHVAAALEPRLLELVKLRASILNGCAFCVDMHGTEALANGEDLRRVLAVAAWRESPFFTPAERAALALTDAVTRLGDDGVDDDVWQEVTALYDERTVAELVVAIATINVWNRFAVTTHLPTPALAS